MGLQVLGKAHLHEQLPERRGAEPQARGGPELRVRPGDRKGGSRHPQARDPGLVLRRRAQAVRRSREDAGGPGAQEEVARGRRRVQGRARCRSGSRRSARGCHERRLRLQAGGRIRQGHRDVRAVHLEVRRRKDATEAEEWGPECQAAGRRATKEVRGARQVPEDGLHHIGRSLRAVLRLSESCGDLRQDQLDSSISPPRIAARPHTRRCPCTRAWATKAG